MSDERPGPVTVPIPYAWRNSAAGPTPLFDYLHLMLHPDGSVTWLRDAPEEADQ